jgi:alkanesulfonate monooxygenase SsuD/methylene tetrahydromethanopterin reductase-like flavin-dependent oxidoreductase (luciferase family)
VATFTALYCGPDREEAIERGGPAAVSHMGRITRYFGAIAQHKGYAEYKKGFEERENFAHDEVDPMDRARSLIDEARLCVGDPDSCAAMIERLRDELGIDQFLGVVQYSDLSHEETMRTIELMGKEVIPRFAKSTADVA